MTTPHVPRPTEPTEPRAEGVRLVNRELAWLDFNRRVLQEAEDPRTPFFERLGFLAIVSSNLDEFYRVRVASLRNVMRLGKRRRGRLPDEPGDLLADIHRTVQEHQNTFGRIFRTEIVPGLAHGQLHFQPSPELILQGPDLSHFPARVSLNHLLQLPCFYQSKLLLPPSLITSALPGKKKAARGCFFLLGRSGLGRGGFVLCAASFP